MEHKWLTATALASMLALSPALAQEGQQQQQPEEQQQPEKQQVPEQQPEQQPEEQQVPEEQQPEQQPREQQVPEEQQPEQLPPEEQQQLDEQQPQQQDQQVPETISAMKKEQVVGKELYGAENQRIGKIRDVVQTGEGEIEAVVLDVGGFLGIGAKQIAVPVYELEAQGNRIVAADLTEDEIKKLPEYRKAEEKQPQ